MAAKPWKRGFFTIWTGEGLSLLGSSLAQFALVWWLTETTGSAMVLTTATLVALLPTVILGPLAGALVDRWDRRWVMIGADLTIAAASLVLAVVFWSGAMAVWHVYAILFIRALATAFHWPSMQASTSLLVPEEQLARVAGLNQTLQAAMAIVSPPLGAVLLSVVPLHAIMLVDVGTALCAVFTLALVRIPRVQRHGAAARSVWGDVRAGLRYVWSWPGLLGVLIIAAVINFLFQPAMALMPLFVTEHFGGEAIQLAWLQSAVGVGMLTGGVVLGVWGGFRRRILTSLAGLVGMGAGMLLAGVAPSGAFSVGLAAMFLTGVMLPITNGPFFAILQARVPPDMQGRVFTVMQSVAAGMAPLGMLCAGPISALSSVQIWYAAAGVSCVFMAAGALFVPAIMHLEDSGISHAEQRVPVPVPVEADR